MKVLSKLSGNKLLKGTLLLSASALITKIFGVLFKIPLSYILMDEGMGYFNVAYSIFGFFYILSTSGVPKAMAMLIVEDLEDGVTSIAIYKYVLKIFAFLGIVLSLIFLLISPWISVLMGSRHSFFSILSVAPSVFFVSISGVARGYFNGTSELKPIAVSQLIEALSKLVLGLSFAFFAKMHRFDLPIIAAFSVLGITIGSLFSLIYLMMYSKHKNNGNKNRQIYGDSMRRKMIKLAYIAIPLTLSSSLLSLSSVIDVGIIIRALHNSGMSEVDAVSLYGNYSTLALPMLNLVAALLAPVCVAYLPKLTSYHLSSMNDEFNKTLDKNVLFITTVASPIACAYYYYSYDILDILFPSNASVMGSGLLSWLSPAVLLLPLLSILNTALEAKGWGISTLVSLIFGTSIKLFLTWILVSNPSFGILGASISSDMSYMISIFISLICLKMRGTKLNLISKVLFPVLASFISFTIPYHFVFQCFPSDNSIFTAFLCGVVSLFIYTASLFFYHKVKENGKNVSHYVQKA